MVISILLLLMAPSVAQSSDSVNSVSHDDVISALNSFLASHEVYESIPCRLYTKRIMDTVSYPNTLEIKIVNRSRDRLLKSDNFQVAIMSDGKTIRRFELKTYIGIEVPVAVISRDLKRGERIDGAYDFRWCDLTGTSIRSPIYEGEEISNRVVRVTLRAGRELDEAILEMPDLVRRGDKVAVVFANGGLALTLSGKALQNGKIGDTVDVLNESSGRTVVCEVTGEGTVTVKAVE